MSIDNDLLHDVAINLLYGSIALGTFVALERLLYYTVLALRAGRIAQAIERAPPGELAAQPELASGNMLARAILEYVKLQGSGPGDRARAEDIASALYLQVDDRINARLWILDTIITAAPLLGLLGTILGIMDTFSALAASGISDPGAVSRGIGLALFATALGIGAALYCLLWHNLLHRSAEGLSGRFKTFLLRASA